MNEKSLTRFLAAIFFAAIFLTGNYLHAGNVETISVYSNSMHKGIPVNIILPDSYEKKSAATPFPVVYLLHGYSGNFTSFPTSCPVLVSIVDTLQIIIVCPDGGFNSWYIDSPVDSTFRYETFISKELVDYIDAHYQTIKDRNDRAISGLSMGGHGALLMALRHPDIFGEAGSMSGGVNLLYDINGWDLKKQLGDFAANEKNWLQNSVYQLTDSSSFRNTPLIINCGKQDFFLQNNRAFNHKLDSLHIRHLYAEIDGAHDWEYWCKVLPGQIHFFANYFQLEKH